MDGLALYLGLGTRRCKYDAGAANLQAALGLRGAEDLDVGYCLNWLDRAANFVDIEAHRHSYQFRDQPQEFENRPAYFCMLVMVTVLHKQLGVRYNPLRIRDTKFQDPNCFDPDFSDSRDLFIHGMIGGPGGTCASMPVLFVSVGRRLGYPLKLVQAKGHLFLRWDDLEGKVWSPGDRFNIEATCEGLRCPPDEHYMQWPVAMNEKDLASGTYLRSMTDNEEVAMFRSTRATCLWENGRYADALRECQLAWMLAPDCPQHSWQIMDLFKKYRAIMASKTHVEREALTLCRDEEEAIAEGIVRGHIERLQRGQSGYNLAEYGIRLNPSPYEHPRLADVVRADHKTRPTLTCDAGVRHAPGTMEAMWQMEWANRMTEFNQKNQARLRQGLPGLNPKDFGV